MKCASCMFACVVLMAAMALAADAPTPKAIIEISQPQPRVGRMSTVEDKPTEQERPFREKITEPHIDHWAQLQIPPAEGQKVDPKAEAKEKERKAKELAKAKEYTLAAQAGQYVGWFGIVRKVSWNEPAQRTELLVQHCYNDGLTDPDIQVVSIYGAGDFRALVSEKSNVIRPLSLVRVYGKVSAGKDGVAEVSAEYLRVWDWGLFTFMNYGIDKTSETWKAKRHIAGEDIYTPRPTTRFYETVLGQRDPSSQPTTREK